MLVWNSFFTQINFQFGFALRSIKLLVNMLFESSDLAFFFWNFFLLIDSWLLVKYFFSNFINDFWLFLHHSLFFLHFNSWLFVKYVFSNLINDFWLFLHHSLLHLLFLQWVNCQHIRFQCYFLLKIVFFEDDFCFLSLTELIQA